MRIHCDKTKARYKQPSRFQAGIRYKRRMTGNMPPVELYSPEDALKAAGLL